MMIRYSYAYFYCFKHYRLKRNKQEKNTTGMDTQSMSHEICNPFALRCLYEQYFQQSGDGFIHILLCCFYDTAQMSKDNDETSIRQFHVGSISNRGRSESLLNLGAMS